MKTLGQLLLLGKVLNWYSFECRYGIVLCVMEVTSKWLCGNAYVIQTGAEQQCEKRYAFVINVYFGMIIEIMDSLLLIK